MANSVKKDSVIQELSLRKFGSKGWYSSKAVVCKVCGRSDKTGIKFFEDTASVHCMRCSVKEYIGDFLKRVGLSHLVEFKESVSINRQIENIWESGKEEVESTMPEKKLPLGFKEVEDNEYLNERGFLPYHYKLFKPGTSKITQVGNIIIQIFDDRGVRVAWLSRSTKSKEWHKENLRLSKEGEATLKLRYDNSPNTDFSKILGGYQEITENTTTLILVEGIFDKVNVDRQFRLDLSEEIKCNFTFGDSIKEEQIKLLKKKKSLKNIYLLYDNKTIEESKRYGIELEKELDSVEIKVCEIVQEGKDPGNMLQDELIETIDKSVSPLIFKLKKLNYV